ncbi:hypothetical protein [Vibrio agarivorans]|uniref:hypothetical protein n=1 Tax=Vibrio agarivorans TaxID=153622 RepID=UPI0025B311BA|nr:hypothetical protein [Vibrio agarivorans]MDN3661096.1 hypothetical protein [Vibrio agarivorans]
MTRTLTLSLSSIALALVTSGFSTKPNAAETWTLELSQSCDSFTLELPLPALDASCDLDTRSGNPSNWFNPFETCSLDFDMIGLPTMGDIAAGIAGQVCDLVKDVKSQTIDKVLDEINATIPDDIFDDITGELDLNGSSGSSGGTDTSWRDNDVAQPDQDNQTCYTSDVNGSTITVPCDIAQSDPNNANACYFKSTSYSNPFTSTECSRYTQESEICIADWVRNNETGQLEPQLSQCTTALRQTNAEACSTSSGGISYCRDLNQEPSQMQRLCSIANEYGSTTGSCYQIDKTCYGHFNGVFQAASCSLFHDNYFNQQAQGSYDDFWSNIRTTDRKYSHG